MARFTMPLGDSAKAGYTLSDADAFVDAVRRIVEPMSEDEFMSAIMETELSKPLSFLLIHAAELALKVYLYSKGKTIFGHSLGALMNDAKAAGFVPLGHFEAFVAHNADADQNVTTRYSAGKDLTTVDPRQGLFCVASQLTALRQDLFPEPV